MKISIDKRNRGDYMVTWGYEFYLLVLKMKVSLTRSLRSRERDTFSTRR